jgi:TP901 family phage tail tape measure protein
LGASFYGELLIRITADNKGLAAGLNDSAAKTKAFAAESTAAAKASGAQWQRIGLGMQNVGRMMTQFVTIPVVGGLALAAYSGIKYENTLLKIKNLTGNTAAVTQEYGKQILALSKTVGVGPQALGEAFYFVASSGFKAEESMTVLTAAAKASASGLGDVQVTADVITSAMNAYGHSNLSASRAVDILMKTIEVGKAEPVALATSLGRIMPIAAKLGVPLGQVGGMIAGLTLTGNSAAEAVTALRGTMVALVAPAKMSIDQLKSMGMSYQDVTRSIKSEGLIATLQMLYEKTDGNMLSMRKLIPNVRALNGVMSLLGANYKRNVEITKEVINSNGKLDESFAYTQGTTIQKLKVAWASLQASFVEIGQALLPTLADMATKIASVARAFSNLPASTKGAILWAAAFVAAAGPVLMVLGSLARAYGILKVASAMSIATKLPTITAATTVLPAAGMGAMLATAVTAGAAVAIAAAATIAITSGLKEGMSRAKKETTFWGKEKGFWTGMFKGMKDAATEASDDLNELMGGAGADRMRAKWLPAITAVDNALKTSFGFQHQRLQDLHNDMLKAYDMPKIQTAMKLDTGQTKQQLVTLRNEIVKNLHVPVKEATKMISLLFPKSFKSEWANDAVSKISRLKKQASELRESIAKKLRWGDLDVGGLQKQLANVKKDLAAALKPSKSTALKLKLDISAGGHGGGGGGGRSLAAVVKTQVEGAITAGNTAAAGATSIGSGLSSGAAAGVNISALVGPAVAMVRAAIAAANAEAQTKSPSKKMMKLGANMTLGLVLGLKKGQREAITAASELAQNILSVLEGALGIGSAIGQLKEQGLPSTALAKKWASRVAKMVKSVYAAMKREVGNLNLLDKENKDKTIPGAGTKFSAFATLVGDIGGIFSAFSGMTTETITQAIGGMALVKTNAKKVAAALMGMVKAFRKEIGKYVVTEFASGNADRAATMAGSIASIFSSFAELTPETMAKSLAAIDYAKGQTKVLAAAIGSMVKDFSAAIGKTTISEDASGNSDRAMALANGVAGVFTTFATLTEKMVTDAITGAGHAEQKAGELATLVASMVTKFRGVMGLIIGSSTENGGTDESGSADRAMALASGVAGVFSTFSTLTAKMVNDAIVGATSAADSAGGLAIRIGTIVNKFRDVMRLVIGYSNENGGTDEAGNADRAMALASGVAGVFATFSTLTAKMVGLAIDGASAAVGGASALAGHIVNMVASFRDAMKVIIGYSAENGGTDEAGNADRAMSLASSVAGVFSTFSTLTAKMVGLAIDGASAAATRADELAGYIRSMVESMRGAMAVIIGYSTDNGGTDEAGNADRAMALATGVAGVFSTFSTLTAKMIDNAVAGMKYATTQAPALAEAMVTMVRSLQASLAGVTASEEFVTLTTSIETIVGNVGGILKGLVDMTEKAINDAIYGAGWVSYRAVDLGDALNKMIGWLSYALTNVGGTTLESLRDKLTLLGEIATAISGIVSSLASMTAEQLAAATTAGSSLGSGFYDGLLSWHDNIVALAGRIAADTTSALAGSSSVGYTPALAGSASGGGGAAAGDVYQVYVQTGPVSAASPEQAQSAGGAIGNAIIVKLATAKRATGRGN